MKWHVIGLKVFWRKSKHGISLKPRSRCGRQMEKDAKSQTGKTAVTPLLSGKKIPSRISIRSFGCLALNLHEQFGGPWASKWTNFHQMLKEGGKIEVGIARHILLVMRKCSRRWTLLELIQENFHPMNKYSLWKQNWNIFI